MTRKISNFALTRSTDHFAAADSDAASSTARFPRGGFASSAITTGRNAVAPYRLWDPTLLDRLHVPLTRHHE